MKKQNIFLLIVIAIVLIGASFSLYLTEIMKKNSYYMIDIAKYNLCYLVEDDFIFFETENGFKYSTTKSRGEVSFESQAINTKGQRQAVNSDFDVFILNQDKSNHTLVYQVKDSVWIRDVFSMDNENAKKMILMPKRKKCELFRRYAKKRFEL
jgi:uncharacterized membrane protein